MTTYVDKDIRIFYNRDAFQKSLRRKKRSTCRLKAYSSNTDNRTWIDNDTQRRYNILELHNTYGVACSTIFPWMSLISFICSGSAEQDKNIIEARLANTLKSLRAFQATPACKICSLLHEEIECCRRCGPNCHKEGIFMWRAIFMIILECQEFKDCFNVPIFEIVDTNAACEIDDTPSPDNHKSGIGRKYFCNNSKYSCINQVNNSTPENAGGICDNLTRLKGDGNVEVILSPVCSREFRQDLIKKSVTQIPLQQRASCVGSHGTSVLLKRSNECIDEICNSHNDPSSKKKRMKIETDSDCCLFRIPSRADVGEDNWGSLEDGSLHNFSNFKKCGMPTSQERSHIYSSSCNILSDQDKKIVCCVKEKLYCIIEDMKQSTKLAQISQKIIVELKSENQLLQERIKKQSNEFNHIEKVNEQQQNQINCMERLERKLRDICQERCRLRGHLQTYSVEKNDEIDVLKKKQSCLSEEVKRLQIIEGQLSEVKNERDVLFAKVRKLERRSREKDDQLCSVINKLEKVEECNRKLQRALNCCLQGKEAQASSYTTDFTASEVRVMREKISGLKQRFFQLENIILSQDRCLHEQHNYILEQEELRVCLQKKVKDLTCKQIHLLQGKRISICPEPKRDKNKRVSTSVEITKT